MSLKRVFHYYWPQIQKYKVSFYTIFATYGLAVIFSNVINPFLYKRVIDLISVSKPDISMYNDIFHVFIQIALSIVIFLGLYRAGDYFITYFQGNVIREIHNDTFDRLLNHSYKFFSNNFSGSLVAKSKRFAASFERMDDILIFNFWFICVELIGVFIVLFLNAPKIGFLFFGWAAAYILITFFFIKFKIKYDLLEAAADSKVTAHFADSITNIINIKIFSGKKHENNLFENVTLDEYNKRQKAWNFSNLQNMIQSFLMGFLEIFILYLMINLWIKGSITTGTVVLVQFYMFNVFHHLWDLGKSMVSFFKSLADAKEMADIFDQNIDIRDISNPEKCSILDGEINFKNVEFEYIQDQAVFKNFNLIIQPGEKIGFVGHSGSGKSTITRMLLRFVDIKGGEILIDGQDITKLKQDDLRANISYVPQDPVLFHRNIKENISYPDLSVAEEKIIEVAQKAHAHEFISTLQYGYETLVGERGVKLSGGERQRVAIARAMLKNSPILILDEATSSLDSISESYIQEAFEELMKGKTTIVIAHRLSTIQKMDRIIVLDKGKIVEEGTHKELLEKDGVYADLWNHQTGGFLE